MIINLTRQASFGNISMAEQRQVTVNAALPLERILAPAKVGVLTTRTDNDTGSLTMNAGHLITTGQRLDLYWVEAGVAGSRRGMVVGTVSGNVVPIDLGSGDNLPTAAANITAMVPTETEFKVTGNNVIFISAGGDAESNVVLADGANVELYFAQLTLDGQVKAWYFNSGDVNPLAGDVPVKAFMSHGDSTQSRTVRLLVGY